MAVSRETIELAYLAALQHLPAKQRAILILRDVLGWSAKDTAALLELSVPSANSALQRARSTMRKKLPTERLDWAPAAEPTAEERSALQRFMNAFEQGNAASLTALLREDARQTMPLAAYWLDGRDMIVAQLERLFSSGADFRMLATAANRQPAAVAYLRQPGDSEYRLSGLNVLRIEDGKIGEITSFSPELCSAFGLPPTV